MQIRLTLALGSRTGGRRAGDTAGAAAPSADTADVGAADVGATRDVLVTAPSGTPLSAVTAALASTAASGGGGPRGGGEATVEPTAVYAGTDRLDPHRQIIGEPPLVDGTVVTLHGPAAPSSLSAYGSARARLHVVAGPDAGGVHLLQGGKVRLGRSAEADVPLDDPDVSRLHCAVTVTDGGAVTVNDLGSTNGTTLGDIPVGTRPVLFRSGAVVQLGESAVRLEVPADEHAGRPAGAPLSAESASAAGLPDPEVSRRGALQVLPSTVPTRPDGLGRLLLAPRRADAGAAGEGRSGPAGPAGSGSAGGDARAHRPAPVAAADPGTAASHGSSPPTASAPSASVPSAPGLPSPPAPGQPGRPTAEDGAHAYAPGGPHPRPDRPDGGTTHGSGYAPGTQPAEAERPRGRGLGAWARRFSGGRPSGPAAPRPPAPGPGPGSAAHAADTTHSNHSAPNVRGTEGSGGGPRGSAAAGTADGGDDGRWPDPAAVLLTALGPGPRIWERGPGHPDAMTVRLGTAHRTGGRAGDPVTVDLRTVGALGLAGPQPRLAGLARSVVSQLAALHGPGTLEIVLLSADRSREAEERAADWSWLGWLPHLRPAHGQDCRLLTAYDRDQAAARTAELLHVLDQARREATSRASAANAGAPAGVGTAANASLTERRHGTSAVPVSGSGSGELAAAEQMPSGAPAALPGAGHSPSARTVYGTGTNPVWETATSGPGPGGGLDPGGASRGRAATSEGTRPAPSDHPRPGPYTLLIVDGDPGTATAREAVLRLAAEGADAGIHVLCLADTPPATPASPLTATIDAAYESSPAFRACGTLGLLSGAVATAVRVVRPVDTSRGTSGTGRGTGGTPPDTAGTTPDAPGTGSGRAAADAAGPDAVTVGGSTVATVDAVSAAWAGRFARALAPLREPDDTSGHPGGSSRAAVALPQSARLLDELGLGRATPAALQARWAEGEDGGAAPAPARARLVFGAGPGGPVEVELGADRAHSLVAGPAGAGKTELLRSLAASLAAGERPDRLRLMLLDGADGPGSDDLRPCLELPHAEGRLQADDPGRMREFAQWLSGELKWRLELIGTEGTYEEYERYAQGGTDAGAPNDSSAPGPVHGSGHEQGQDHAHGRGHGVEHPRRADRADEGRGEDTGRGGGATLSAHPRVVPQRRSPDAGDGRTGTADESALPPSLPRLVILVDDFDTLVDPALGNPGRPAAGSIVRSLEAVARDGARLGVHLIAATGRPESTAETTTARSAALRAELRGDAVSDHGGREERCPGRGTLTLSTSADRSGAIEVSTFQAGRITGRIPRTSTLRPTVVPLDWLGAGDPPTRRPVRELGNGPTDLALLASAISRAAQSLGLPARAPSRTASTADSAQDAAPAASRAAGPSGTREGARKD